MPPRRVCAARGVLDAELGSTPERLVPTQSQPPRGHAIDTLVRLRSRCACIHKRGGQHEILGLHRDDDPYWRSVLAGSLSGKQNAAVAAEPRTVTELGYEAIFDGWQEAPLARITISGRGAMSEVDPQAQRMYEQIAADLEQPPAEFVEASWSGYEFIELNDEIRKSHPDIYVTASRANPALTSSRYDLVFTEYPPADLIEKVRDLPVDVDIRYGAPLTYAALDGVQSALSDRFSTEMLFVVESSPLGTSLRLKYSPRPGALDPETQGQRLLDAAREVTNALTVRSSKPPTIDVERDDQLRLEENFAADYMGGWGYTGSIGCTSGFAATLNGVRGLLTADHCPNLPTYVPTGWQMRGATSAGFQADIQFNPAPIGHEDRVVRRFRIDGMGNTRSATGVANPPDGHFIEKWGQVTGYTWGYVNQPNMCNASNTYCHLFRVNMNGEQGDSGGPCVNAQAAHGLVQGGVPNSYTYCTQISMSPATVLQW